MRGRSRLAVMSVGAVVAVTAAAGWGLAGAAFAKPGRGAQAAAASSGSIVEDFAYPGAADVHNVILISGDGHIMFGDCTKQPAAGIGRISVFTQAQGAPVCFDDPILGWAAHHTGPVEVHSMPCHHLELFHGAMIERIAAALRGAVGRVAAAQEVRG